MEDKCVCSVHAVAPQPYLLLTRIVLNFSSVHFKSHIDRPHGKK